MKSNSQSLPEPANPTLVNEEKVRYDVLTKQKINKHLNDINDIITDDDIRNIDTNLTLGMLKSPKEA